MFNKNDIINAVHNENGGSRANAERLVETVFKSIKQAVKDGNKVSVGGFGIFTSKQVAARNARNPRTGEVVKVASFKKVKFSASIAFKKLMK